LNGEPVFLKGISIHEEAPYRGGRCTGIEDSEILLGWAKELGCNFVRLAHYPHNESIVRLADEMGIMVWSEIPVYWTIQFGNLSVFENALNQLQEMIKRDKNRASVIIWSVANETPRSEERLNFLNGLIEKVKSLDESRLVTAATEIRISDNIVTIDDPLAEKLDVIGVNEYFGWYVKTLEEIPEIRWASKYNKPLIMSELGGGAKYGHHGNTTQVWTEEYQEAIYKNQIVMLKKIPFLAGVTPWILMDFRSPRRPLPGIQDYWNRKGLLSEKGEKKKAFYILQDFYIYAHNRGYNEY
jgi:beta-glucuronidase